MANRELSKISGTNVFVLRPEYVSEVNEHLDKYQNAKRASSHRRLNKAVIECALAAMPALIARVPTPVLIDANQIAADAMVIAHAMALAFINKKLI
jgi:hypothetical protein